MPPPISLDLYAQVQAIRVEIAEIRVRIEESSKATRESGKLSREDYERRLSILNNAHERADKLSSTFATIEALNHLKDDYQKQLLEIRETRKGFVTRELHDQLYRDLMAQQDLLRSRHDGDIKVIWEELNAQKGRTSAYAAIFAGLVAVAGLGMTAWHIFSNGVMR